MRLYEFEGKQILKGYGIAVPEGAVITSINELHNPQDAGKRVVKAQLLTVGSRAKFGAVKVCESFDEVKGSVAALLDSNVLGERAHSVLLEEKVEVLNEYYLGIAYDTDAR